METVQEQAKQTMERNQVSEMVRRGRITADTAIPVPKTEGVEPYPLEILGQRHVVLNVAHSAQHTRSQLPAFRIGAVISNPSEARVIVARHEERDKVEWLLHPCHRWKLLSPAPLDGEEELKEVQRIYDAGVEKFESGRKLFEEYCDRRRSMEIDEEKEFEDLIRSRKHFVLDGQEEEEDLDMDVLANSLPATSATQRHGQKYAAIGIIWDDLHTEHPEQDQLIVSVFAAFDEEREATRYVRDTLSDTYKTFDMFVVRMYAWCFPHVLLTKEGDQIQESYRHKQIQDMMRAKRTGAEKIRSYEAQCQRLGIEPSVTEINLASEAQANADPGEPGVEEAEDASGDE